MYKNTFNLSGWSGTDNICYRCYATKDNSRDCTTQFGGAMQRKTTMDYFVDCITEGKQISALFCAPGFQVQIALLLIGCMLVTWELPKIFQGI